MNHSSPDAVDRLTQLWSRLPLLDVEQQRQLVRLTQEILSPLAFAENEPLPGAKATEREKARLIADYCDFKIRIARWNRDKGRDWETDLKGMTPDRIVERFREFLVGDARLNDLWYRRALLSEREWTALYKIVYQILVNAWVPEYEWLPGAADNAEERKRLIDEFFSEVVFRRARLPKYRPGWVHAGGIRVFYRNYLRDLCRDVPQDVRKRLDSSLGSDRDDDSDAHTDIFAADDENIDPKWIRPSLGEDQGLVAALETYAHEVGRRDEHAMLCDKIRSALAALYQTPAESVPDARDILEQANFSFHAVVSEACAFLEGAGVWQRKEEHSRVIRAILGAYHCLGDESSYNLLGLQERYRVKAAYYWAERLGVPRRSTDELDLETFWMTLRGQWLWKLSIPRPRDRMSGKLFLAALDTLCHVAILYWDLTEGGGVA